MVVRVKFIALSAFIKNLERAHASDLTAHLKILEQTEADKPKRNRWQEIIMSVETKKNRNKENNTKNY